MFANTRMLKLGLALSLVVASSGCFRYGVAASARSNGTVHTKAGPVLFWGLKGREHDAPECKNGVASSASYMPWWGGAGALLTLGIATPWRLEYTCFIPHTAGRSYDDDSVSDDAE